MLIELLMDRNGNLFDSNSILITRPVPVEQYTVATGQVGELTVVDIRGKLINEKNGKIPADVMKRIEQQRNPQWKTLEFTGHSQQQKVLYSR